MALWLRAAHNTPRRGVFVTDTGRRAGGRPWRVIRAVAAISAMLVTGALAGGCANLQIPLPGSQRAVPSVTPTSTLIVVLRATPTPAPAVASTTPTITATVAVTGLTPTPVVSATATVTVTGATPTVISGTNLTATPTGVPADSPTPTVALTPTPADTATPLPLPANAPVLAMVLNDTPPPLHSFTLAQIESGEAWVVGSGFPPNAPAVVQFWPQNTDPATATPVRCTGGADDHGAVVFGLECTTAAMGTQPGDYQWQAVDAQTNNPQSHPYLFTITR